MTFPLHFLQLHLRPNNTRSCHKALLVQENVRNKDASTKANNSGIHMWDPTARTAQKKQSPTSAGGTTGWGWGVESEVDVFKLRGCNHISDSASFGIYFPTRFLYTKETRVLLKNNILTSVRNIICCLRSDAWSSSPTLPNRFSKYGQRITSGLRRSNRGPAVLYVYSLYMT
jgi:hypothetical protein